MGCALSPVIVPCPTLIVEVVDGASQKGSNGDTFGKDARLEAILGPAVCDAPGSDPCSGGQRQLGSHGRRSRLGV